MVIAPHLPPYRWRLGVPVFISVLVFAVLAPLLWSPGFILLHDWTWTPSGMSFTPIRRFPGSEAFGSSIYPPNAAPLMLALAVAGRVAPEELVQRVFLSTIFVTLAIGAYQLPQVASVPGRLFAVSLAVVNPWVLDRLFIGQWSSLAGIAILPWAWSTTFQALRTTGLRPLLTASLAWGMLGVMDTHAFALFAIAPPIAAGAIAIGCPGHSRATLLRLVALFSLTAALTLYWTVPAAMATAALDRISLADLDVYATRRDPLVGLFFNVLSMHGFWYADDTSKIGLPLWWVLACVILGLALVGFRLAWRDPSHRVTAGAVALTAVISSFLAMGAQGPTGSLFVWMFEQFPSMRGLRDAQRAAMFLPLAYAYLGSHAVAALAKHARNEDFVRALRRYGLTGLVFLVVFVYGFRMFWGGLGALRPSEFPASWVETRAIVSAERDAALLTLPWHRFMKFSFTDPLNVVNPAPRYFGGVVFASDDDQIPIPSSTSNDRRLRYLEALLQRRDEVACLGNLVSVLGIRYVFLANGPGYEGDRAFLDRQCDLERVQEWEDAVLYRNMRPAAVFYGSAKLQIAPDLTTLIRASIVEDLTESVWLTALADDHAPQVITDTLSVGRARRDGSIHIKKVEGLYLQTSFADPEPGWRLQGTEPLNTLTPTLAFPAIGGVFRDDSAPPYNLTYLASTFALVVALCALKPRCLRLG